MIHGLNHPYNTLIHQDMDTDSNTLPGNRDIIKAFPQKPIIKHAIFWHFSMGTNDCVLPATVVHLEPNSLTDLSRIFLALRPGMVTPLVGQCFKNLCKT